MTLGRAAAPLAVTAGLLIGCAAGPDAPEVPVSGAAAGSGFQSGECNGITDADVQQAVGAPMFTRVAVSDAGCFWQENTVFGTVGVGKGISTWWYRGSDIDDGRLLEMRAGRTLTEVSINGHQGFRARDDLACSVYLAKDDDVIAWTVQTINPVALPELCSIVEQLAELSQDHVN